MGYGRKNPQTIKIEATTDAGLRQEVDSLSSQLAETSQEVSESKSEISSVQLVADGRKSGHNKQCIVSFLNDDGNQGQYNDLFPIMQELNVPYGQAIYTSQWDKHTKTMMENIIALGGDLSSHTVTHAHLPTLTESEIETEFRDSRQWFLDQGIPCDYIVYPFGEVNDLVRKVAKRYYKFGVSTEGKVNGYPIEDFNIKRVALGSMFDAVDKNTYTYYKSKLDEAIANKSWIIFMLHSNTADFDATQKQYLRDIIADIKAAGVPIMSPSKAYEYYSNAIKVGDNSTGSAGRASNEKHLVVSKFGDFSTNMFTPITATKIRLNAYGLRAVPANGSQDYDFTITDSTINFVNTDTMIFNIMGSYEKGLIPYLTIKDNNKRITLRLTNVTDVEITPADRVIRATLLKGLPADVFPSQTITQ